MALSAESPQEFGDELRRERELRDVSREHLAAAVRISIRQLEALETGRFEILPAKVFSRGFVRAIAVQLGLDAEHYAAAFSAAWDGWDEQAKTRTSRDIAHSGQHVRLSRPRRAASMSTVFLGVGIALAIGLVTFAVVSLRGRGDRPAAPRSAARVRVERATVPENGPASLALPPAIAAATVALPPAGPSQGPEPPTGTSREFPRTAPSEAPREAAIEREPPPSVASRPGLVLALSFRDDCWTEVSADGKAVAAELFRKGTVREFPGAKRFVVTFGNAAAVAVSLNGVPVALDVPPGQVLKNFVLGEPQARPRPPSG